MIQEDFKDISIKYLYVNKFIWQSPIEREQFQGQPLKHRVYRDIFNPLTGNHKLLIPGMDGGIGFDKLKDTNEAADFDLKEITLDTVLDYDITENDLDLLNQWIESGNRDIEDSYRPIPNEGLQKLKQALHSHNQDEAEALAMATDSMMNLWSANPEKFSVMVSIIQFLTDADLDSYEDIAHHIRLHPVSGKGVNVAQALRAIDNYNSDDRRTNEDVSDLYMAIEALVTEAERKFTNDLID